MQDTGVKTEHRNLSVNGQVELVIDLVMEALKSARGYEVSGCVTPIFGCDLLGEAHQEDPRDLAKFKVELQISELQHKDARSRRTRLFGCFI